MYSASTIETNPKGKDIQQEHMSNIPFTKGLMLEFRQDLLVNSQWRSTMVHYLVSFFQQNLRLFVSPQELSATMNHTNQHSKEQQEIGCPCCYYPPDLS